MRGHDSIMLRFEHLITATIVFWGVGCTPVWDLVTKSAAKPVGDSSVQTPVLVSGAEGFWLEEFQGQDPNRERGIWKKICITPCARELIPGRWYRIDGFNRYASAPVKLPDTASVRGSIDGGSTGSILSGTALIVTGMVIGGVWFWSAANDCNLEHQCDAGGKRRKQMNTALSGSLFIGGITIGAVQVHMGRQTSLSFAPNAR